eukprot:CAMPEP_0178939876 /NCGR_PEP_ID=MMETSP0789-20121207/471_1 /TAXON_ID=3005 /ORGANISM="Rhizosolenia setigera, Strain CCMP 1694" /LENGTH=504 /DNA_ID=CAMNT_0020618801 /DNA_START=155 /DNA_END=1669 /DNA_ORIENTATION=-
MCDNIDHCPAVNDYENALQSERSSSAIGASSAENNLHEPQVDMQDQMQNDRSNIALQLLHSTDTKIAAAAKRIFSMSPNVANSRNITASPPAAEDPARTNSTATVPDLQLSSSREYNVLNILAATASSLNSQLAPMSTPTETISGPVAVTPVSSVMDYRAESSSHRNHVAPILPSMISSTSRKDKKSKNVSADRLQRRERNRMHARKTRQRKKEHVQFLQDRAEILREEQIRLKLQINEKNTANILAVMCWNNKEQSGEGDKAQQKEQQHSIMNDHVIEAEVEVLLQRSVDEIPSSSKIMELPAFVLPGSKKRKGGSGTENTLDTSNLPQHEKELMAGIDFNLLCKDRSKCTPDELDRIRRERNRMHAKRTRDRKRIYTEEMESLVVQLEKENNLLHNCFLRLSKDLKTSQSSQTKANAGPLCDNTDPKTNLNSGHNTENKQKPIADSASSLDVEAVSFQSSSVLSCNSAHSSKRVKLDENSNKNLNVPQTITTTSQTAALEGY